MNNDEDLSHWHVLGHASGSFRLGSDRRNVYELIVKQRYYHKIFQQHPRTDRGRGCGGKVHALREVGQKYTAPNLTNWEVVDSNVCDHGRFYRPNVLRETARPKPYAKREICDYIVSSAWRLLITEPMFNHIKKNVQKLRPADNFKTSPVSLLWKKLIPL